MDFSSKDYLPDSERRIETLRKIVRGRPVAILAAGPSIAELEERIDELKGSDICYFGFNNFFVQEKHILGKIGKHMDVIMGTCRESIPEAIDAIIGFLDRNERNMFISSFWRDTFGMLEKEFDLKKFLNKYDKKLLFSSLAKGRNFPSKNHPLHFVESNSLLLIIQLALIGKASSILLFGADGYCKESRREYYYHQHEYQPNLPPKANQYLIQDTRIYFNPLARSAVINTCKTYDLPLVNILNCSVKSFYSPFPKISYDAALEFLVTGKKIIGKLDLRVPMKPKLPNVYLLAVERVVDYIRRHKWKSLTMVVIKVLNKMSAINKVKGAGNARKA